MRSERARWATLLLLAVAIGCDGRASVHHPHFADGGLLGAADPVPEASLVALRGIFETDGALRDFGPYVSVFSTATSVSLFGDQDARYALLDAGCLDGGSRVVLEGEQRVAISAKTGLIRLEVQPASLATALCAGDVTASDPALHDGARLEGVLGSGDDPPGDPASARFRAPLVPMGDFIIAGHRGSCRTSDECGPSENSIESFRFAERFAATLIEMDVRFTADSVPVVFHDDKLSARLSMGRYCVGFIADLTLAHLDANCRLRFGEAIPTLEEALTVVLEETHLSAVWLDVKEADHVPVLLEITDRIHARAAEMGRDLKVHIGCPSQEVYDALLAQERPDAPCLVELGLDETIAAGCEIWGPRYTLGPMPDEVERAKAAGIETIFWTVDGQEFVDLLLTDSDPSGILSNRPHLVFHRYQMTHGALE